MAATVDFLSLYSVKGGIQHEVISINTYLLIATMFRRLPNDLPKDIIFPIDLEGLGYFVNDNDQIRQVAHPDQKYQYKINRNDRVNDVYKEAINSEAYLKIRPV